MSDDEATLIRQAAAGDEPAFIRLVDLHRARVFNVALMLVRDRAVADEVTQDTFVRLFRSLSRFRHDARLSTWLHRVVVNACHDLGRRRTRDRRSIPLGELPEQLTTVPRDQVTGLDVRSALARLPPDLRAVVSLRYAGGLSYQEIADILQWPLGTVCTRLHRALKLLGHQLDPEGRKEQT